MLLIDIVVNCLKKRYLLSVCNDRQHHYNQSFTSDIDIICVVYEHLMYYLELTLLSII
jgi:hypothetical protein